MSHREIYLCYWPNGDSSNEVKFGIIIAEGDEKTGIEKAIRARIARFDGQIRITNHKGFEVIIGDKMPVNELTTPHIVKIVPIGMNIDFGFSSYSLKLSITINLTS